MNKILWSSQQINYSDNDILQYLKGAP
jgi:hypothetical protein